MVHPSPKQGGRGKSPMRPGGSVGPDLWQFRAPVPSATVEFGKIVDFWTKNNDFGAKSGSDVLISIFLVRPAHRTLLGTPLAALWTGFGVKLFGRTDCIRQTVF